MKICELKTEPDVTRRRVAAVGGNPRWNTLRIRAQRLLENWLPFSVGYWEGDSRRSDMGFFGTGYSGWGVQTNQRFSSALGVLSVRGSERIDRSACRDKAVASLRFSLASHGTGSGACSDGRRWGRHWLSALGLERMMHGVELLRESLDEEILDGLERVICSEAKWILEDYERDGISGITGNQWASQGGNGPESNIWNGALLWRAAHLYPHHESAEAWKSRAHEFFINGVSIPADASDETICAGATVSSRFRGANFFPHYALDHHGYLNVGYMTVCVSNAAFLHFDARLMGLDAPESLYHHQSDLWQVLRRMIFSDGRLARIGGDNRVRYTYCQDYLVPSLLLAADHFGERHSLELLEGMLDWMETEQDEGGDGSFLGGRLMDIRKTNPYYYLRLESDRACVLGALLAYGDFTEFGLSEPRGFEASVEGGWIEPEHGAVLHRCPTRFASFSWNAFCKAQGICVSPEDGNMVEWLHNLSGWIQFAPQKPEERAHIRRVLGHASTAFPGGFLTIGALAEGGNSNWAEGWQATDAAMHWLAIAALPDGHTMVGLQLCVTSDWRTYLVQAKGLHLNVVNDVLNGFQRTFHTAGGTRILNAPSDAEQVLDLNSTWVNIDDRLGAVVAFGAPSLVVCRNPERSGDRRRGLFVEEVGLKSVSGCRPLAPRSTVLDAGWVVQSASIAAETRQLAKDLQSESAEPGRRSISLTGRDGIRYRIEAVFPEVVFENFTLGRPATFEIFADAQPLGQIELT